MARKSGSRAPREDIEADEVDAFSKNREKIMLDEAGEYGEDDDGADEDSEEEVMRLEDSAEESGSEGNNGSESEDGNEEDEDLEENEEEEEEGWGGRQNYYGGDDLSEDEDSKQITEEALRQQKKHLKDLSMADYVDEDMEEGWQKTAEKFDEESHSVKFDISKQGTTVSELEDKERLAVLKTNLPEFEPLLKEMVSHQQTLQLLKASESSDVISTKITALSAYLGAIAAYFAILTEKLASEDNIFSMKDDPVMETILATREVWRQASGIAEAVKTSTEASIGEYEISESSESEQAQSISGQYSSEEQVSEESADEQNMEEDSDSSDIEFDITSKRKIKKAAFSNGNNDYKENLIPEDIDKEEKQRRRRTLRFYTSKIDQAASKNSQDKFSGDVDIPYKERLFERQQRLIEEARKRGLEQKDDFGDDNESLEDDEGQDFNVGQDGDAEANDYYSALSSDKKSKKLTRQKAYDKALKAAKQGLIEEANEDLGEGGKRAINYQILKNKGLTPHRKKDNRNARVKKRKKYEKAQKKLKSVRQVYDASNRGPYEGEKTGIKKGLSRSVKLV